MIAFAPGNFELLELLRIYVDGHKTVWIKTTTQPNGQVWYLEQLHDSGGAWNLVGRSIDNHLLSTRVDEIKEIFTEGVIR